MFKIFRSVYTPIRSRSESPHSDEEHHGFIDDKDGSDVGNSSLRLGSERRRLAPALIPWLLAVLSIGLFLNEFFKRPSDIECARLLSPYSPAMEVGVIEYYDTNFQNEFGLKSEYIGVPTPELEKRWDTLWNRGGIEIPLDGAVQLNKSTLPLKHAMRDPERGYVAILEVFHQLHCLNLVRQYTWKDYYTTHLAEWMATDGRGIVDLDISDHHSVGDRMHVDHCIEALRLGLMCNADVTPLLILEDERGEQMADFNVHHKCRNWDKVNEWQYAHNIEREDGMGSADAP